jgi:hypothetical protein
MFDGRFSPDKATEVDLSENITDISSARRTSPTNAPEVKAPVGTVAAESNPFPDVDDIVDRLSNRIDNCDDCLSAAS